MGGWRVPSGGRAEGMAKRRKHRRLDENWDEDPGSGRRGRRKRRRRFETAERASSSVAVAERGERPKPPVTCHQCAHLVITRSFVKHVSQSWDRAIIYPTFTCFQQRWTLEDPDSVDDHSLVSEYLVSGADSCPDFSRGYPRSHEW
jgi:hypothetical protein